MTRKNVLLVIVIAVIGGGFYMAGITQKAPVQVKEDTVQVQSNDADLVDFLNYDIIIGDEDAPIEIIEYAAITCPHCAHFHADVHPVLKEKYLDTGKAKLVYRNFVFDNPFDVYAASITRCVSEENFLPTLEVYFENQPDWNRLAELKLIYDRDGREAAINFAKAEVTRVAASAGISPDDAKKCLDNKEVVNYLLKVRGKAVEKYQVNSTPTVIVDGKMLDRNDIASIEKAIEAVGK